jgi:hypothetical protein
MTEHQDAKWNVAAWHGKMLVDRDGAGWKRDGGRAHRLAR